MPVNWPLVGRRDQEPPRGKPPVPLFEAGERFVDALDEPGGRDQFPHVQQPGEGGEGGVVSGYVLAAVAFT